MLYLEQESFVTSEQWTTGRRNAHLTQVAAARFLGVSQPYLSPDGRRVMYIRWLDPGHTELWASDLDGANKLKLASGSSGLSTIDWSANSRQLSFVNVDGKQNHTYVVGADGRDLHEIKGLEDTIVWGAWSADGQQLFFTSTKDFANWSIWTAAADGSRADKLSDRGFLVTSASPDKGYLFGFISHGGDLGIYQMSLADGRRVPLLPGVDTFLLRFAPDFKSFVYAVAGRGEVTFYRQGWRGGALVGTPQVALKVPFAFPLVYKGNALDISRDLSTIVYVRPSGQHDLYFLSQTH